MAEQINLTEADVMAAKAEILKSIRTTGGMELGRGELNILILQQLAD